MLDVLIVLVVAVSTVWVYLDATKHNVGKIPGDSSFWNSSAGVWSIVTLLLWIVAFPAYLIKRGALIEKAKASPVTVTGRTGKASALGTIGGLWTLVTFAAWSTGTELPSCNEPEVLQVASEIVKRAGVPGKISNGAERNYDAINEKRQCHGTLGGEVVGYTVQWYDKSKKDQFVVTLGE